MVVGQATLECGLVLCDFDDRCHLRFRPHTNEGLLPGSPVPLALGLASRQSVLESEALVPAPRGDDRS